MLSSHRLVIETHVFHNGKRWSAFAIWLLTILLAQSCSAARSLDFVIPKQSEINIVANQPQGRTNISFECHIPVEHERILLFFAGSSKVYVPEVDIFDYSSQGHLTLPKKLSPQIQAEVDKILARSKSANIGAIIHIEGALITKKHKIYFWRLYSDYVLLLWREDKIMRVLISK